MKNSPNAPARLTAADDSPTPLAPGARVPSLTPSAWGGAAAAGVPARWLWAAIGVLALGVVGLGTALALQGPPLRTATLQPSTDLTPSNAALPALASLGDPGAVPGPAQPVQRGAAPGAASLGAGSLPAAAPAGAMAPAPYPVQAPGQYSAQAQPVRASAPVCSSCGRVESVQAVQQSAPATGVGAVAGGVLGAVVGNQIGRGNGRAAATVLGAAGGGYVGHRIEQNTRTQTTYQVRVRMDDGSLRRFTRAQPVAEGTPVRVQGKGFQVDDGRYGAAPPRGAQPMQVVDSRY